MSLSSELSPENSPPNQQSGQRSPSPAYLRLFVLLLSVALGIGFAVGAVPAPLFLVLLLVLMVVSQVATNYLLIISMSNPPDPLPLPTNKYKDFIDNLKLEALKIERLGFTEFDRYYFNLTGQETLNLFFKHQKDAIYCHLVQMIQHKILYAILYSEFPDDIKLLTVSAPNAGHLPHIETHYIQVLERADYAMLLEAHQDGLEVLADYGYRPLEIDPDHFRSYYRQQSRESFEYIQRIPFWMFKLSFWILSKAGKRFHMPLREQVAAGITQLPGDHWH
jgi:hypothetical protein